MRFTLAFISLFLLYLPGASHATWSDSCTLNADGEVVDSPASVSEDRRWCRVDMQEAQVTFYKIYLCENQPTQANYTTACEQVFDDPNGYETTISPSGATTLPTGGDISIPPTTYRYFALLVDGNIGNKMSVKFASSKRGYGSGTGQYCWTQTGSTVGNNNIYRYNSNMNYSTIICGDEDDVDADFAVQKGMLCVGGNRTNTKDWATDSVTGRTQANYAIDSDQTSLNAESTGSCPSDPTAISDWDEHNLVLQLLETPVIVGPNVSVIEFSMKFTDFGRIRFRSDTRGGCNHTTGCVTIMRSMAPLFTVTVR